MTSSLFTPGTKVRIYLNAPNRGVRDGAEGTIVACPTREDCTFVHVLPTGRLLPLVVRSDEVDPVSTGGIRVKTRMARVGDHEVWSAEVLAGMVGQSMPYKDGGETVGAATVFSAEIEDGWVVLELGLDIPAPERRRVWREVVDAMPATGAPVEAQAAWRAWWDAFIARKVVLPKSIEDVSTDGVSINGMDDASS